MRRRPPRSTQSRSSAASDVYKRQVFERFPFMKGIEEEPGGFRRGDRKAELLEALVGPEPGKIIEAGSSGDEKGDEGFNVVALRVRPAFPLLDGKGLIDGRMHPQRPHRFHDEGQSREGSDDARVGVRDQLEGKDALCYSHR